MENTNDGLNSVVAFIDIGTNSVRLLLVRLNPNYSYTVISQEKEVVRLGEREFIGKGNSLNGEAIRRAVLVCKKFVELSKVYGATKFIAVATSAVREALNKDEFLASLESEAGLKVSVISGREEARLVYLGISSGVNISDQNALFIDLGGGSTELVIGTQNRIDYIESFKLGAIRLTDMFLKEGRADPIPRKVYETMKQYAAENLATASKNAKAFGVELAFGTSGTFTNLAEISNRMFHDRANGLVLERGDFKRVIELLCGLPLEKRKNVRGINPARADILVGGGAIVDAFFDELELRKITVSSRGLREGMLVDYLSKIKGFPQSQNISIRDRSVMQLARSCNFDERHSTTVASLAMELFDSAKRLGLHNFTDEERELLRYAALLHDVGDFISFDDHHIHSHYIICNAGLLGFDQSEIRIIANIARFHRKKFPQPKDLKNDGLDSHSQELVIELSTFLRLAEALDRGHCGAVKKAAFTGATSKSITLSVWSDGVCYLEEWRLVESTESLENFYGGKFVINWIQE